MGENERTLMVAGVAVLVGVVLVNVAAWLAGGVAGGLGALGLTVVVLAVIGSRNGV